MVGDTDVLRYLSGLDYPALVDALVQSALRRRPGLLR